VDNGAPLLAGRVGMLQGRNAVRRSDSTRRMRAGLGALALVVMPFTAACSASYGAETQAPYDPGEGIATDTGHLDLRNVVVVSETEGSGTLVGVLLNQGERADRLTGVRVQNGRSAVSGTDDGVRLPPETVVALGTDSGETTALPAMVEGDRIRAGYTVRLTFDFERSASVSVDAEIVPPEGAYADVPTGTVELPGPIETES
jgi:hypothetical protein